MKLDGFNIIDSIRESRTFDEFFPEVLIADSDVEKSLIWVSASSLFQCAEVVYDVATAHEIINHCLLCLDCQIFASRIVTRYVHYGKCITIFDEGFYD